MVKFFRLGFWLRERLTEKRVATHYFYLDEVWGAPTNVLGVALSLHPKRRCV